MISSKKVKTFCWRSGEDKNKQDRGKCLFDGPVQRLKSIPVSLSSFFCCFVQTIFFLPFIWPAMTCCCNFMLQPDCFPMNMYGKRSGRHLDRIHFLLIVYSNYKSRSLFRTFSSIPVIRKRKGSLTVYWANKTIKKKRRNLKSSVCRRSCRAFLNVWLLLPHLSRWLVFFSSSSF